MKRVVRGITKPKPPEPPKSAPCERPHGKSDRVLRRQISIDPEGEVNVPVVNEERLLRALDAATERARQRSPQVGQHRRNAIIQAPDTDFTEAELRAMAALPHNVDEVNIDTGAALARRFALADGVTVTGRVTRDTRREPEAGYGDQFMLLAGNLTRAKLNACRPGQSVGNFFYQHVLATVVRLLWPMEFDEVANSDAKRAITYAYSLACIELPSELMDIGDLSDERCEHLCVQLLDQIAVLLNDDPESMDLTD